MKTLITTVAMGLYMVLATGAVFAGGDEHRDGRKHERADRYESKIYGTVRSLPSGIIGIWNVNGRNINVTQSTIVKEKHGKAAVGAYVEVEGNFDGDLLNAFSVEVKRDSRESRKIHGTIESLSTGTNGAWIVNGEKILVQKDTLISERHGRAMVGAYVEVEGVSSGNALAASKIEVKRRR